MDSNLTEALCNRSYSFLFQKMKKFWLDLEGQFLKQ